MTALSASKSSAFDPDLKPGETHLWLCDTESVAALDGGVLTAEERARRAEAAQGRALVRHLLAAYCGAAPERLAFEVGRHGKPSLCGSSLQFNLSHSNGWFAVAVSGAGAVGVDVQVIERERNVQRLAQRYFQPAELAALERLDAPAYRQEFFHLWALKEAWTKARGGALPTTLGAVGFLRHGPQLEIRCTEAADCSVWLLDLPGYGLALCAQGRGRSLRCLRWHSAAQTGALELPRLGVAGVA